MRPLRWAHDIPVLDGGVMDVIHVAAKIFLVAKGVFPIPALPYSAFAQQHQLGDQLHADLQHQHDGRRGRLRGVGDDGGERAAGPCALRAP